MDKYLKKYAIFGAIWSYWSNGHMGSYISIQCILSYSVSYIGDYEALLYTAKNLID